MDFTLGLLYSFRGWRLLLKPEAEGTMALFCKSVDASLVDEFLQSSITLMQLMDDNNEIWTASIINEYLAAFLHERIRALAGFRMAQGNRFAFLTVQTECEKLLFELQDLFPKSEIYSRQDPILSWDAGPGAPPAESNPPATTKT